MAFTGTAPTTSLIICEGTPPPPTIMVGADCSRITVVSTVLQPVATDFTVPPVEQLNLMFSYLAAIFGVVFVILMVKKAIEQ